MVSILCFHEVHDTLYPQLYRKTRTNSQTMKNEEIKPAGKTGTKPVGKEVANLAGQTETKPVTKVDTDTKSAGKTENKQAASAETKPAGKAESRQAGKGSKRRPFNAKQFSANYETIRWSKGKSKRPKR